MAMDIASAIELGRRFFRTLDERGLRHAMGAAVSHVEGRLRLLAGYLAGLARRWSGPVEPRDHSTCPKISVLMATWNRATLLPRAINSVLAQSFQDWELIIIDDGSTDETPAILASYAREPRIRVFHRAHGGVGTARNAAFEHSRANIIAYLDSDNEWSPAYLEAVERAFSEDSGLTSTYCAVRRISANGTAAVHFPTFDAARLRLQNFIDLNVFAHRRRVWDEVGGFDPALPCLNDWDLIRRYARHGAPRAVAIVGAQYHEGKWPRITTTASAAYASHLIMSKEELPIGRGLRVLYALRHLRELSRKDIGTETARFRRWGVGIEAWSEVERALSDGADFPAHRGSIEEAIAVARPDILHFPSPGYFERCRSMLPPVTPPITLGAWDFAPEGQHVEALCADPLVSSVFAVPGTPSPSAGLEKLHPIVPAFDPRLYGPPKEPKERRLVFRAATGSPCENLPQFLRLAKQLPELRFVLALARCTRNALHVEELRRLNEQLQDPVDLRVGLTQPAVAALAKKAAIYLHSFDPTSAPLGMPSAVAEAMASGTFILAQNPSLALDQIGDAGRLYDSEQEAAGLLRGTLEWSDAAWDSAALRSIERAFAHHLDSIALRPILDRWLKLAGHPAQNSI